jgi:hypothetical protein
MNRINSEILHDRQQDRHGDQDRGRHVDERAKHHQQDIDQEQDRRPPTGPTQLDR